MKTISFISSIFLLALIGCSENVDLFSPDPPVDLFRASAFVEIVDQYDSPVEGAIVHAGNYQVHTNDDGIAHLDMVSMSLESYVTVEKPGYFHGSRRFYPVPGKTHFLKIQLLSLTVVADFQAGTGAEIQISGGTKLLFPANAVSDQGGNPYSGIVQVAAQPIYADDPALSDKMPGDLVGRSMAGEYGSLSSLGMIAVQLTDPSGEPLQVTNGENVEMRMPVPEHMLDAAPSTIPLWYFDELEGIWKEEGEAVLIGGEYVGSVGHFTYWNYDAWFPIVKWGATFLLPNGEPAVNVSVCITILQLETTKCASTNEDGFVCGMVAADQLLLVEVKDQCQNVLYSEVIGPYTEETMIGPITLDPGTTAPLTISGNAIDCEGAPVTNGFAIIKVGNKKYFAVLDDSDGSFSADLINCNEEDLTVTVFDEAALKQSLSLSFSHASSISTGTIQVCEDLQEFISVEGEDADEFFFDPEANAGQGWTTIYGHSGQDSTSYFYLSFQGEDIGTYSAAMVTAEIGFQTDFGEAGYVIDVEVVINYYGNIGDYITGTLTGTFNPHQGGDQFPVTGEFSVLRE